MCGILGIVAQTPVNQILYDGLAGAATSRAGRRRHRHHGRQHLPHAQGQRPGARRVPHPQHARRCRAMQASRKLSRLGVKTEELERNGTLEIWDWYTVTLGLQSKEKYMTDTLKVAELSIHVSRVRMRGPVAPDQLAVADDVSVLDRFNDEKSWVEYELARSIPAFRDRKITACRGVIRELYSSLVYK